MRVVRLMASWTFAASALFVPSLAPDKIAPVTFRRACPGGSSERSRVQETAARQSRSEYRRRGACRSWLAEPCRRSVCRPGRRFRHRCRSLIGRARFRRDRIRSRRNRSRTSGGLWFPPSVGAASPRRRAHRDPTMLEAPRSQHRKSAETPLDHPCISQAGNHANRHRLIRSAPARYQAAASWFDDRPHDRTFSSALPIAYGAVLSLVRSSVCARCYVRAQRVRRPEPAAIENQGTSANSCARKLVRCRSARRPVGTTRRSSRVVNGRDECQIRRRLFHCTAEFAATQPVHRSGATSPDQLAENVRSGLIMR